MVTCANGRYLADHLPHAVYIELPGAEHFAPEGDADAIVDAVCRFAEAGWVQVPPERADRWLATMLFTDIVGSTEIAARLGYEPVVSRAVGAANGANPIPVVVPCHRVIGSNGTLTGYAGGIERKQILLNLERPGLF